MKVGGIWGKLREIEKVAKSWEKGWKVEKIGKSWAEKIEPIHANNFSGLCSVETIALSVRTRM